MKETIYKLKEKLKENNYMGKFLDTSQRPLSGTIVLSLNDKEFVEAVEDTLKRSGWNIGSVIFRTETCEISISRSLDRVNDNQVNINELQQEIRNLGSEVDTLRAEVNTLRQMVEWRDPQKMGPRNIIWSGDGPASDPYIRVPESQPFAIPCEDLSGPRPWESATFTSTSDFKYDVRYGQAE